MKTFLRVWVGQLFSSLGSGLTSFALGIWVYQQTNSNSLFALAALAGVLPTLLLSPVAGVLVDRWDRRAAMLVSELAGGACSALVAVLLLTGRLEVWHVYALVVINASVDTLRTPAWAAATTLLVPKEQLGRASGMVQMAQAVAMLVSPLLAGFLMASIGLPGVLLIDAGTFTVALVTLLGVRFPRPKSSPVTGEQEVSLVREALQGWDYVQARGGLLGILLFGFLLNFLLGMAQVSIGPLVLSSSTSTVMGTVMTAAGAGMLVGSILMGAWGGPRRRIHGFLGFSGVAGLSLLLFGLLPTGSLLSLPAFCLFLCVQLVVGSVQVIWQRKVPPELQGRVFALRSMFSQSSAPLAYLLVGPLVDGVLGPAMLEGGRFAGSLGPVLGVGPGRGTALLFVGLGTLLVLAALLAYAAPRLRRVEEELPDVLRAPPPPTPEEPTAQQPALAVEP